MIKTLIAAAALIMAGITVPAVAVATASNPGGQVCSGTHLFDATGPTHTYTAPTGQLVAGYCVKAGSVHQGNGPEYHVVDPPQASVTFSHSSGKDISHYSVTLVPVGTEPTDPTTDPTEPTDPTTDPTDPTTDPTDPTTEPTDPSTDPTPTDPTTDPTDPSTDPAEPEPTEPEPTDPTDPGMPDVPDGGSIDHIDKGASSVTIIRDRDGLIVWRERLAYPADRREEGL